jgi:hypothetical protein
MQSSSQWIVTLQIENKSFSPLHSFTGISKFDSGNRQAKLNCISATACRSSYNIGPGCYCAPTRVCESQTYVEGVCIGYLVGHEHFFANLVSASPPGLVKTIIGRVEYLWDTSWVTSDIQKVKQIKKVYLQG